MILTECLNQTEAGSPLKILRADLDLVRRGEPAKCTTEDMLRLFNLDGDTPDGKSLGDRLMGGNDITHICHSDKAEKHMAMLTVGHIDMLIKKVSKKAENEHELELAKSLIAVAEKQLRRESSICELASRMYLAAGANRPELVNADLMKRLKSDSFEDAIRFMIMRMMRDIGPLPDDVEIVIGHPRSRPRK